MIQQGKLIVIEGGDGSGKGTQSAMLKTYLEKHAIPHAYIDLPDYNSLYGKIIAAFLRGEFGTIDEVSPYLVSMLFALDRKLQRDTMNNHLKEGKIVLANRYITSNIAHQGSKFKNEQELAVFTQWIENLEYHIHGMPKESLVIYLYVPWEIALELTMAKATRTYLGGESVDIQEKDHQHRKDSERMYRLLAEKNKHWTTIDCTKNGTILSKEEIHKQVLAVLQKESII